MLQDKAIIDSFQPYLPKVKHWLDRLLVHYAPTTVPLASLEFSRLPYYFSEKIIENTKVVLVDKVPMIPLAELGVTSLGHFENLIANGVTYKDTVFINQKYQEDEWLYFHELIHVLQWQAFGYDGYLLAYGLGLYKHRDDYTNSFFEAMAFENQEIFQKDHTPFNVEKKLTPQIERHKAYFDKLIQLK